MRPLLLALVLTCACGHAPRLPADGRRFEEPEYAADLRARILGRNADVYACHQKAAAAHPPQGHEASALLGYHPKLGGYFFQGPPKDPAAKFTPPTPFRTAFEACLGPRIAAWGLPPSFTEGTSARFHFLAPGASMPPPPDLSKGPEGFDDRAGMDPAWSSPLFDEAGVRGYVDIAWLSTPRLISGEPFRYPAEALARRIEGLVSVRCTVTTEGLVQDCAVQRSLPGMDQLVLETLATQRYVPVHFRNKPVTAKYTFAFQFRLPRK